MRTSFKTTLIAVVIASAGLSQAANAHDRYDYGHHDTYREVVRQHQYIYYPHQQVYYSPSKNNWFWAGGNGWQVSTRLPGHLNVNIGVGGIPIFLNTERPYAEHVYVEQTYGRPWRDSHRYIEPRFDNNRGWEASRRHEDSWGWDRDDHRENHDHEREWHRR